MEHKQFDDIKRAVAQDTLLAYPDFNTCFDIHTDARNYQLGAVIIQNGIPIALYSHKMTGSQKRYTVTEKEWFSIVETLKEFYTILLDQQLNIYTDHQNLTCIFLNKNSVLWWRLILE